MRNKIRRAVLDMFGRPLRRKGLYSVYDWSREMPRSKRLISWAAMLLQVSAVLFVCVRSLEWPMSLQEGRLLCPFVLASYVVGLALMNRMLTSELVRKTELEADQIAARQIQQTLIPRELPELPGYVVETFYQPLRAVGGDYFDVIDLPGNRTLFAIADVSGKGMPAALLAANIQALVRSIANVEANPLTLARQIDRHLCRYTPSERFATAVFIVLSRASGELTYVNAGHNPPVVFGRGSTAALEATGMPLGLFPNAAYEASTSVLSPGGALLLFTDGLTDSIPGENAENRLLSALADSSGTTMSNLKSLVDARFNEDDVTILLVRRDADAPPSGELA
jgi:serine phosphatase RsbU (regulator of sigma subunit)